MASVPKEISDKLDKEEQKRQEIIFETIYTEEDYVKDLNLLEEVSMGIILSDYHVLAVLNI